MVISASVIKKPRTYRFCDECGKHIQGETTRIFGYAERGDRPCAVYMHRWCAQDSMASDLITNHVIHPPNPKA